LYGYILDGTDEDVEAVEYYRKAAAQDYPAAQFSLGAAYLSGEGVKQNPEEGHKWVKRAAENGHGAAISQMAMFSLRDAATGKQDNDVAQRWILKAAENDFIPAMEALAQAYRTGGYGLQQDDKLAAQWDAKVLKVKGLDTKKRKRKGAAK
jgi:TPR repeat protein